VVPLGFLTLASRLIYYPLGKLLAPLLAWLTVLLLHVVQWFAHFPRWSYRIPGPSIWLVVIFFSAAVFLAAAIRLTPPLPRKMVWAAGSVLTASALVLAIFPFESQWEQGKLEVTILDVGQGDSLFVVFPRGKTMLIDGGGALSGFPGKDDHLGIDPGEEAVSPYLWSRRFQKLDVVALTHAHQDHVGGLTAVLNNFRVGRLWIGREVNSMALKKLEELARSRKIPIEYELRGRTFSWGGRGR
jgi:competence protein ComEC